MKELDFRSEILGYLAEHPDQSFTANEIREALKTRHRLDDTNIVSRYLFRLGFEGRVTVLAEQEPEFDVFRNWCLELIRWQHRNPTEAQP